MKRLFILALLLLSTPARADGPPAPATSQDEEDDGEILSEEGWQRLRDHYVVLRKHDRARVEGRVVDVDATHVFLQRPGTDTAWSVARADVMLIEKTGPRMDDSATPERRPDWGTRPPPATTVPVRDGERFVEKVLIPPPPGFRYEMRPRRA